MLSIARKQNPVFPAFQLHQNYIEETLNHPVLSAPEASAEDIKATYDVSNHQESVLGRQYVDRKN